MTTRTQFAKLLKILRKNAPDFDIDLIRKAYRFAETAHRNQMRLSGEPYISHSLAAARILANLKLDETTVAAGLLHDVLEDTRVTMAELEREFGPEIAALVDGVTKIGALYMSSAAHTRAEAQAASIRKMLVATIKDVRVILIKLADRIHNMRTIEFLSADKIKRISQETLDIYAPLAHRLGIASWKWELEDHAFHRLHPVEYKEIAARVVMKRREREAWLDERIASLQDRLQKADISASVIGRPKHLYSIYRKMIQQMKDFDEVMDMQALRIITETTADCYNALGIVHRMWKPIPGRFKDYIPMPKPNGYQSIHTTVICEQGKPLEVQIRTKKMDEMAQVGIAAHWLYKEGDQRADRNLEERLKWLRQMYESLQETRSADEFLEGVRRDVQMSEVFAFTPKGDVKELPAGATPLDFAYLIHSDVGHHCMGARVNGRIVPLNYNLQTGDRVEILTSKSQTPHIGWLEIVASPRARNKIRQRLREIGQLEPLEQDKDKDKEKPKHEPLRRAPIPKHPVRVVDEATRQKLIRVQGHKNMAVSFARCCNPMPGHAIVGYLTRNPGITIHRTDCRNFARTTRDPKRVIRVAWEGEAHYEIAMRVVTTPRPNMLADITDAIRPLAVEITTAKYQPGLNGHSDFEFVFNASDQGVVDRVIRTLRTVAGVSDASALSVREVLES